MASLVQNSGIQSVSVAAGSTSWTFGTAPTVNNKVLVCAVANAYPTTGAYSLSAADNASPPNTYTPVQVGSGGAAGFQTMCWFWADLANVPTQVTVSAGSGRSCYWTIVVLELNGLAPGGPDTGAVTASGATSPNSNSYPIGPTATLAQAAEWVFTAISVNNSQNPAGLSVPSGTTSLGIQQDDNTYVDLGVAYEVVASTAAISFNWGVSTGTANVGAEYQENIITFAVASSPPVITAQPTDQTVNAGATATFSVTATGATGYQWQDDSSGSFANISGATSSSYAPTAAYSMQGRNYQCVVSNGSGNTTSSTAKLRVAYNVSATGGNQARSMLGMGPTGSGPFGFIQRPAGSSGTAYTLSASPLSFAVTMASEAVNAAYGLSEAPASYAVTMAAESIAAQRPLAISPASYAVSMSPETFAAAYGLSEAPASYSATMAPLGITGAYGLSEAPLSYAVSMPDESLAINRALPVSPTSYAVTASPENLQQTRGFSFDPASYSVSVLAESLGIGRTLSFDPASFNVSAAAESFTAARFWSFDPASYAVTPAAEALAVGRLLGASPASYAVSMPDEGFQVSRFFSFDPASYSLTAANWTLTTGSGTLYSLSVAPNAYAISAAPLGTSASLGLSIAALTYAVSPAAVGVSVARTLGVSPAVVAVTMSAEALPVARGLSVAPMTVTIAMTAQQDGVGRVLAALAQSYAISMPAAGFRQQLSMQVAANSYAVSMAPVSLLYQPGYTFAFSPRVLMMPGQDRKVWLAADQRFVQMPAQNRNFTMPADQRTVTLLPQRRIIPPK